MASSTNYMKPPTGGMPFSGESRMKEAAEKAKETAADLAEKAKESAADAAERAKEMAETATDKAREVASAVAGKTGEMASAAGHKAEDATAAVGGGMKSLAHTIRDKTHDGGVLGSAGSAVATTLESGGRYLEEEGLKGIGRDLTELIRRNPIPALFVGIGIGFLIARATRR